MGQHRVSEEVLGNLINEILRFFPVGSRWRHKKTGGIYTVENVVVIESSMQLCVVYRSMLIPWCRPVVEFGDGRFERVNDDSDTAEVPAGVADVPGGEGVRQGAGGEPG